MAPNDTPEGYRQDAHGNLIPESKVKEIDKLRHQLVTDLCQLAEAHARGLRQFKQTTMQEVASFIALSLEQYGVKSGGEKGNASLTSFDGRYKLVRHMQDKIVFGEQLMAAKALIDECVRDWAQGASDNIKVLVNHAFQTDKAGKINTARVLGLRQLDIRDPAWLAAMEAIADSMQTASTKAYVRFYKRVEATGEYEPISLDVASA